MVWESYQCLATSWENSQMEIHDSTVTVTVQIFLYTRDGRNSVENIIFHASHAGFMCDTCSIHENIWEMVKSCVECSFVGGIFT